MLLSKKSVIMLLSKTKKGIKMKTNKYFLNEYLKIADRIMLDLKEKDVTVTKMVRCGVTTSTVGKVMSIKSREGFLSLRGTTVYRVCKALDNIKGTKTRIKLRELLGDNDLLLQKWRKELNKNDKLSRHILARIRKGHYNRVNNYVFMVGKMIDILDYANDLEVEWKRKQENLKRKTKQQMKGENHV